MATPLPAVPPPPSVDTPPPPEPRDPLADRANAAALDATLSKGRAALFDATLDRPIPSRMQPLLRMPHRAPAPRGRFARKMEAPDARRDRGRPHEVAKRQGAARVATAQEFEDVRKRRARTRTALRAQRQRRPPRRGTGSSSRTWLGGGQGRRCFVRQEHGRRRAAERGEAASSSRPRSLDLVWNYYRAFVNAHAIGQAWRLHCGSPRSLNSTQARTRKSGSRSGTSAWKASEALKQRERDAVRKHNDEKLLAAGAADIQAAVRERRDVAERELMRRANGRREMWSERAPRATRAVIEALERDAREATDAESPRSSVSRSSTRRKYCRASPPSGTGTTPTTSLGGVGAACSTPSTRRTTRRRRRRRPRRRRPTRRPTTTTPRCTAAAARPTWISR